MYELCAYHNITISLTSVYSNKKCVEVTVGESSLSEFGLKLPNNFFYIYIYIFFVYFHFSGCCQSCLGAEVFEGISQLSPQH